METKTQVSTVLGGFVASSEKTVFHFYDLLRSLTLTALGLISGWFISRALNEGTWPRRGRQSSIRSAPEEKSARKINVNNAGVEAMTDHVVRGLLQTLVAPRLNDHLNRLGVNHLFLHLLPHLLRPLKKTLN